MRLKSSPENIRTLLRSMEEKAYRLETAAEQLKMNRQKMLHRAGEIRSAMMSIRATHEPGFFNPDMRQPEVREAVRHQHKAGATQGRKET